MRKVVTDDLENSWWLTGHCARNRHSRAHYHHPRAVYQDVSADVPADNQAVQLGQVTVIGHDNSQPTGSQDTFMLVARRPIRRVSGRRIRPVESLRNDAGFRVGCHGVRSSARSSRDRQGATLSIH
jgi:hypothetical protein